MLLLMPSAVRAGSNSFPLVSVNAMSNSRAVEANLPHPNPQHTAYDVGQPPHPLER